MTTEILIQFGFAILTALTCWFLIRSYHETYTFSPMISKLLIGSSLVISFFFGYLQDTSNTLPVYLETLLIGPLLFLCATDLKALELPDYVNLLVGLLGVVYLIFAPFPFWSGIATSIILFVSFLLIALVSSGALGGGDIKYVLAFGLWIPPHLILPFLLFSTLSASLYGLISLVLSKKKEPLPFGPFLVLSSIYLLFIF